MASQLSEIAELKARLASLEQAQTAPRENREIVAEIREHETTWRAETERGTAMRAELVAERDRLQADTRSKVEALGRRIRTIDDDVTQASERFKQARDPLLRELQAAMAPLVRELVGIIQTEEMRIGAPMAFDGSDPKACADVASRDRRLSALRELRESVERSWWKDDASEGELRARFAKALAAVPKVVVTSGPWRGGEITELALAGGGLLARFTAGFTKH